MTEYNMQKPIKAVIIKYIPINSPISLGIIPKNISIEESNNKTSPANKRPIFSFEHNFFNFMLTF